MSQSTTNSSESPYSDEYSVEDTEIIPREELEETADSEHGPTYRCPRCGYEFVTEYCDCPDCGWAGMCQKGWG